jgi:hypothetical protein
MIFYELCCFVLKKTGVKYKRMIMLLKIIEKINTNEKLINNYLKFS